jgi:hypothetical protein
MKEDWVFRIFSFGMLRILMMLSSPCGVYRRINLADCLLTPSTGSSAANGILAVFRKKNVIRLISDGPEKRHERDEETK